ncbi:testicular haploid expressed gene protein-like isoform X2 [Cuculus canorus]|uniref:testicular haploid expressed gene protein-like isoform X2 n=1 Tax=Cuculus canorus TaxID=55661 RepID=UPI0023AB3C6C|nr:testicular haploid expressed gene protein-like isoform X2 [Cuculus canorus]
MLCWYKCMLNSTFVLFCNFDRIYKVAEPKKVACANDPRPLFVYSCGRESTIWERPLLEKFSFPSDRLLKLAEPKKYQPAYLEKRPRQSPEWPVSPAALNYRASPRILELARPKVPHPEFLMARELPTKVTNAAALARASSRIQHLAEPRIRKITYLYENIFLESVIRPVSKFAHQAIASPRTVELARPKRLHADYVPLRDAEWPVTHAAKHAVATPRILELAQPCKSHQASLCRGITSQRMQDLLKVQAWTQQSPHFSFLINVLVLLLAAWTDIIQSWQ